MEQNTYLKTLPSRRAKDTDKENQCSVFNLVFHCKQCIVYNYLDDSRCWHFFLFYPARWVISLFCLVFCWD